ncbi:hypothetical protein D6D13_05884 [Aureobasidium pullulans]|uniref:Uncharacterized protein n=1 Tax=Aureobasidium pullulans TaxID=5580 RepID=A0A4S9CT31_AURPU|nr:hypothetical protein D6D13_05884 [Aureobasidium pullulans]
MTSSRQSISDEPIVSPHRVSIGRGGRGNMIAPEEIKEELKKASSNDEHDGPSPFLVFQEDTMDTDGRSSSWSLHSSNSGTSKTEAIKDFFRRGSQSKRKSVSQGEILEGKEEEDAEKG